MRMRTIYGWLPVFILLLYSCAGNKLLPGEQPLQPQPGQWWLVNAVTQDGHGQYRHSCALLSIEQTGGQEYRACYTSAWRQADSGFWYGVRQLATTPATYKPAFPISIQLPDTTQPPVGWLWQRNRVIIQAALSTGKRGQPLQADEWQFNFNRQQPFKLYPFSSQPQIWAVAPLNIHATYTGWNEKGKGVLWMHVIGDKQLLLQRAAQQQVVCLNIFLQDGRSLSLLFRTGRQLQTITPDACVLWHPTNNTRYSPAAVIQTEPSFYSGPYPLYYRLRVQSAGIDCLINPRNWSQEVKAGRQTCWMGAMQVIDTHSRQPAGAGNMYVFAQ